MDPVQEQGEIFRPNSYQQMRHLGISVGSIVSFDSIIDESILVKLYY